MKTYIKKLLPKKVYAKIRQYRDYSITMQQTDQQRENGLKELYKRKTGKELNFDNIKTFEEKLQVYKLYYEHPDFKRIVCKYKFKDYIKEKLGEEGYTIPLYGAWTDVEDIDFDSLPEVFVLKSNCQSDGKCIKFIKNKSQLNIDELKQELKEWLDPRKTLVDSYCRCYYDVTPMIIAEKYEEQIDGQLYDYKFFCFNGKPEFLYVAVDHFKDSGKSAISFYDFDWNNLNIKYGDRQPADVPRPKNLEKMIEIAKKLSKDFPFVRVDFFEIDDRVMLSELTFYPGGGFNLVNEEVSLKWGEMFNISQQKPMGRKFRWDLNWYQ